MLDDTVQLSKYIKWKVCDSVENVIEYKLKKIIIIQFICLIIKIKQ